MSFNMRSDLILREHFESMDGKKGVTHTGVYIRKETPWRSYRNVIVRDCLTVSPSEKERLDETQTIRKSRSIPVYSANDQLRVSNELLESTHQNQGLASPLEKNTTSSSPEVKHLDNAKTEACTVIKGIIRDEKSDKRNLISAMESVLNTLKVNSAKKQEASSVKAQVADGFDNNAIRKNWKLWTDMLITHLQLAEAAKKNKASLTDEASEIQTRFLLLLTDEEATLDVLDDMRGCLDSQLAEVNKEIQNAKLMNLEKETAKQNNLLLEKNIKWLIEECRVLQVEASENQKLKYLLEDYKYQVDILSKHMHTTRAAIMLVKKEFEQQTSMVKCYTPSKTYSWLDSSLTETASENEASSLQTSDSDESISESESEESESEASEESVWETVSEVESIKETNDFEASEESENSTSESEVSQQNEDSVDESEVSEESDYSMSESESEESDYSMSESESEESEYTSSETEFSLSESDESEDSDDTEQTKTSNMKDSASLTSQIVTVPSQADPSKTVVSQNTVIPISTNETAKITQATNTTNELKTLSDDDWDLCDLSDPDA